MRMRASRRSTSQAARAAPGVVAVLTHTEMDAAGIGSASVHPPMVGRNGVKLIVPFRPALARERVMHVGQPVALVVAESLAQAQDAAEMVAVDYEELPAVADLRAALAAGAPQLFPEAPGNVALDWPGPVPDDGSNAREIEAIFSGAAHVARVSTVNQRLVVDTMEPRGATARYDAATDSYTLRSCSQGAGPQRDQLAADHRLPAREAARHHRGCRRRVRPEDRGLSGISVPAGRREAHRPAGRLDGDALGVVPVGPAGARHRHGSRACDRREGQVPRAARQAPRQRWARYIGVPGAHIQTNNFSRCFPGMYAIPRIQVDVQCVFTNTVPTGPYRGAGRPEANYALERLVDEAARVTGIDPVRLRRRNLIAPKQIPYKTAVGTTYDSGDFAPILDKALALAHYTEFKKRRRESFRRRQAARHRHLVLPRACRRAADRERVAAVRGRQARARHRRAEHRPGPRHDLSAPDRREARHSGGADRASARRHRSRPEGQSVGRLALDHDGRQRALSRRRPDAGEGKADRVGHAGGGRVGHRSTSAGISPWSAPTGASRCSRSRRTRRQNGDTLDTKATVDTPQTFPNGCHVAEVEIDPDTGVVEIVAYAAVDDAGVVLDHTLVAGQLVGGLAQGIGQALMENAVYDDGERAARRRHVHGLRDAARRQTCRRSPRRTTTRPRPPIRSA